MDRLIQGQICGSKWLLLSEKHDKEVIRMANRIDVEVENVSCVNSAYFINNLKDGDPIPNIGVEQQDISIIYVCFPLGEGEAYLTTEELANDLLCHAPYNWAVEKAYDHDVYGTYFKLYPVTGYSFNPREKLYFSITNMISVGTLEKMVYIAVSFVSIPMNDPNNDLVENANGTDYLACFKKRMPVQIANFEASPAKVAVGDEVDIKWCIGGDVVKCLLTPGDHEVKKTGTMRVVVTEDTEFALYALGEDKQVSKTAKVYVDTPVITSFTSNCADNKIKYGEPVTFNYTVENAYSIYMNHGLGRVVPNTVTVNPCKRVTDYTLSCMGPKGLVQKNISIVITDFLEVKDVAFNRTEKPDGSYVYTLDWRILNSLTSKITTSDGVVRAQNEQKGNITFKYNSEDKLTVCFQCTGNGNQSLENVYRVR